jgi:pimeloyl-ACP methyl ester carboxylesterase
MTPPADTALPNRLQHRLAEGSGDTLVIVFSQVRVPAGKFGLERLFARTRHACLFLNDTANGWYLGLESGIHSAIDNALARTGARKIVYYGSSMGGYGALVTGLSRQDGAIHAFGPELRAGQPGSQSRDYGISADHPDLFNWQKAPRPTYPVHLYFGIYDPVDAINAVTAARLVPEARLHLLRSCHASHDHLYSLNLIRRIITTFSRAPETELASKGLPATAEIKDLEAFGLLAERLAAGQPVRSEDVTVLTGFAENPGMIRLGAEAAAASGDFSRATVLFRQAEDLVEADPVLRTLPKRWRKEMPLRRVECLVVSGALVEARDLLARTCDRFPVDDRMAEMARSLGVSPRDGDVTGLPAG